MHTTAPLNTALADRYEIIRELGRGGMATVYLARDVRHARQVAIKVLHPELAAVLGAERFLAEIKTTANLQHPHILPLFDSGTADGQLFYVMPFVEGETLRTRLDRETQLPIADAVQLAREVADALQYAHERGVIHRDIKPENILLQGGHALVADFGIALAVQHAGGQRMTQTGLSLGTPQYMAPEQAMGDKAVDGRADIYALGAVAYEMLAGEPPFTGPTPQAIVAKVMTASPASLASARARVPAHIDAAILHALEKLPADRFVSARVFADALLSDGATHASGVPLHTPRSAATPRPAGSRALLAVSAAVAVVSTAIAAWTWSRPVAEAPTLYADLDVAAPNARLTGDLAISPDGTVLAAEMTAAGVSGIYIRRLNVDEPFHLLAGTETGRNPDFSFDGQYITFRDEGRRELRKIAVSGGASERLVDDASGYVAHWGLPNQLVYSGPRGAYLTTAAGGARRLLKGLTAYRPFLLPNARGVLDERGPNIVAFDLKTDSMRLLVRDARQPVYASSGHLLYVSSDDALMAVPFDAARLEVGGTPALIADRVATDGRNVRGFALAKNGTLVVHHGSMSTGAAPFGQMLVIATAAGARDTIAVPDGRKARPRYAPDGTRIAYSGIAGSGSADRQLFVVTNIREGYQSQLTFDGNNTAPVWSPDGTRLVHSWDSAGTGGRLRIVRADNGDSPQLLSTQPDNYYPTHWPQDNLIAVTSRPSPTQSDIGWISPTLNATLRPFVNTTADEGELMISPDGTLASFLTVDESGSNVFVQDFPTPKGRWKLTPTGGQSARWSKRGDALYYWKSAAPFDSLFRSTIRRDGASVMIGPALFVLAMDLSGTINWDISPDGERFVVSVPGSRQRDSTPIASRHVIATNWLSELRAKFATVKP